MRLAGRSILIAAFLVLSGLAVGGPFEDANTPMEPWWTEGHIETAYLMIVCVFFLAALIDAARRFVRRPKAAPSVVVARRPRTKAMVFAGIMYAGIISFALIVITIAQLPRSDFAVYGMAAILALMLIASGYIVTRRAIPLFVGAATRLMRSVSAAHTVIANELRTWKPEHRKALVLAMGLGAVLGVAFGLHEVSQTSANYWWPYYPFGCDFGSSRGTIINLGPILPYGHRCFTVHYGFWPTITLWPAFAGSCRRRFGLYPPAAEKLSASRLSICFDSSPAFRSGASAHTKNAPRIRPEKLEKVGGSVGLTARRLRFQGPRGRERGGRRSRGGRGSPTIAAACGRMVTMASPHARAATAEGRTSSGNVRRLVRAAGWSA